MKLRFLFNLRPDTPHLSWKAAKSDIKSLAAFFAFPHSPVSNLKGEIADKRE